MKKLLAVVVAMLLVAPNSGEAQIASAVLPVYYEIPELAGPLVPGRTAIQSFRMRIALELAQPDDVQPLEAAMPAILDGFRSYIGQFKAEELKGSAVMFRLRQELVAKARLIAPSSDIRSLLFKELLVL